MEHSGYIRVSACCPALKVADVDTNIKNINELIASAVEHGSQVALFPELSVTGYTCGDLFRQTILLDKAENGLHEIAAYTSGKNIVVVVGCPLRHNNELYNCAVVCNDGKIICAIPKIHIPNYNEFYEKRWFSSGFAINSREIMIGENKYPFGKNFLLDISGTSATVEICEDLWVPIPPSSLAALNGATLVLNLSATDELTGKHDYLINLIKNHSARCRAAYVYASAGIGESSTDLVFSGNAVIAEDGMILAQSDRFANSSLIETADIDIEKLKADRRIYNSFSDNKKIIESDSCYEVIECSLSVKKDYGEKLMRFVDKLPFVPSDNDSLKKNCEEITSIQVAGLIQRLRSTGCKKLVIGISGGLDSTLALLIAVKAFDSLGFDHKGIIGITMPGFGTTGRTHNNAVELMKQLAVTSIEIPISKAVTQHFADIGHDSDKHDATYENSQARERTQILMDYANKTGGMVLGTGDLSELALGWCTYNGDHMSMYGVNASIPKTLVRYLVKWFAATTDNEELKNALSDVIATPISPELIPADNNGNITQKTEDIVGPYQLHDFFIYHTLRNGFSPGKIFLLAKTAFSADYDESTIKHWLKIFYRRFFNQQFKRSCMPDGPKVGSVCLSPRGDWRMPSDASSSIWLKEVDGL